MLIVLKALRAAATEFFFDLPRMVLLNLFWLLTALPTLYFGSVGAGLVLAQLRSGWDVRPFLVLVPVLALSLGIAGPGTAAVYYVTNRLASGELLEISRFWEGFRRFFWRGWGLAAVDAGAGGLLVLNVVFYWGFEGIGIKLLSLLFAYLLLIWFAVQGYLFSLLVELDQSVRLVVRNALFITIDNLGLTLGLTLCNALLAAIAASAAPVAVPFVMASLGSNFHNKVVVEAVARYRQQGRIFSGAGERGERMGDDGKA